MCDEQLVSERGRLAMPLAVKNPRIGARVLAMMLACFLVAGLTIAEGQNSPTTSTNKVSAQPAVDGVLNAFRQRPLVGMIDAHGLAQQEDFYALLVRDPRFANEVGNVVVEFGGAAHQDIIDRYVAGESVSYAELRSVWTDVVGWLPAVTSLGYINFFSEVRAANWGLAPERRIRVWLGDPPIDWRAVRTAGDVRQILAVRDSHAATLIKRNILEANKKALVIYGEAHLRRGSAKVQPSGKPSQPRSSIALQRLVTDLASGKPNYGAMSGRLAEVVRTQLPQLQAALSILGAVSDIAFVEGDRDVGDTYDVAFARGTRRFTLLLERDGQVAGFGIRPLSVIDDVEANSPNVFYLIQPYTGYLDRQCSMRAEQNMKSWPIPALGFPVPPESDCHVLPADTGRYPQTMTEAQKLRRQQLDDEAASGVASDALLYLGPADTLTVSPDHPDIYLDPDYRAELSRRNQLRGLAPLPAAPSPPINPATPQKWRP